jgi:hypothetical protein
MNFELAASIARAAAAAAAFVVPGPGGGTRGNARADRNWHAVQCCAIIALVAVSGERVRRVMSHDSSRPPKIPSSRRRKAAPARAASEESAESAESVPAIAPLDVARYVGEMTGELARFARSHDLSTLAYFLEMAHIEAGDEARRLGGEPVGEIKPGRR